MRGSLGLLEVPEYTAQSESRQAAAQQQHSVMMHGGWVIYRERRVYTLQRRIALRSAFLGEDEDMELGGLCIAYAVRSQLTAHPTRSCVPIVLCADTALQLNCPASQ